MTITYVKIASVTVGVAGAASMDFTSIPQTYTDLVLKVSTRGNGSGGHGESTQTVKFNGSTTGYTNTFVYQYGIGTTGSQAVANNTFIAGKPDTTYTANTFSNSEMYVPNYTSANYKSVSVDGTDENNSTSAVISSLTAGLWSNTAAITSIVVTPFAGSFVQYSTATLYGIKSS